MTESPLSLNALEYTFRHLLKVAFPQLAGEPFRVEKGDGMVTISVKGVRVVMRTMSEQDFEEILSGKSGYTLISNALETLKIPVFYFSLEENSAIIYSDAGDTVKICCDLLTPAFLLLSRYEEFFSDDSDAHDRYPFAGSLADKYNMVEIPLVDEYAMLLRRWLGQGFPDKFAVEHRAPRVVPTHDIDHLCRFKNRFQALKSILGRDLLINRDMEMVRKSLEEYRAWRQDDIEDPYIQAIMELATKEHAAGLEPVFFFKASYAGEDDATYDIRDARMQRIWEHLGDKQGIVGLHGSYGSAGEAGLLREERERLDGLLARFGRKATCSRQHYLRACFHIDECFQHSLDLWQDAGVTDDYTLGFAERCGFRCGTCHPYPLYDVRNDKVTDIIEHPLIVMDGTLTDYMKLSVEDAKTLAIRLKQRCFDVGGDFVILWHNHAVSREMKPYFEEVYLPAIGVQTCGAYAVSGLEPMS